MGRNSKESSPISDHTTSSNAMTSDNSGWQTGYIQGNTFTNKEVKYRITNGMAMFEGDIILATTPKEIERLHHKLVKGIGIRGEQFRWPRAEIPYKIEPTLPNKKRVTDAIQHWESKTPIRFVQIRDSNAQYYPNFVSFKQYVLKQGERQDEVFHCSAAIGMTGIGDQPVTVSDQCITGDVIHEIGHAVGLWHEQSRSDRDDYVRIIWDNIVNGIQPDGTYNQDMDSRPNFSQHRTDGDNIGPYDYCSIMHYGAWFFSKGPGLQTIEVLRPDLPCGNANSLGQKNGLSNGDISAVNDMYENRPLTVTELSDGRLAVYRYEPTSGSIYFSEQSKKNDSSTWTKWTKIYSNIPSGMWPAIVKAGPYDDRNYIFWIDNVNTINCKKPDGSLISMTDRGTFTEALGDPAAAKNDSGQIEVFWVSNNESRELRHMVLGSTGLTTPESFGGQWSPNRRPVIAEILGRLELFMRGLDNQLYHRWQYWRHNAPYEWSSDWVPIGGPIYGDPVVVKRPNYDTGNPILEVFAIGKDYKLCHMWQVGRSDYPPSPWSDWDPVTQTTGWSPRKTPAVALTEGSLEVFMMGTEGYLWHTWQNKTDIGKWPTNFNQFGTTKWPPGSNPAIGYANGRLELFVRAYDGKIYHQWQTKWNESSRTWDWSPPTALGE